VHTDFDSFGSLSDAWDELASTTDLDRVFMRHLWFEKTIEAYGWQNDLAIVAMWRDGQLVAIAPMFRSDARFKSVTARAIKSIVTDISPRWNFLIVDHEDIEALVRKVVSLPDWDVMIAKSMESESRTTQLFTECVQNSPAGYFVHNSNGLQSPYLKIDGSWGNYWAKLSGSHRSYLRRSCERRLESANSARLVRVTSSDEFRRFEPMMFKISRKSWKYDEGTHLRPDSQEGRFYHEFTPVALEQGLVHLYVLEIDDRAIAFEYLLGGSGQITIVRCDFDEQFKQYSPGNSLRLLLLKKIFAGEDDIEEYDLGGDAYSYKLRWTRDIRGHVDVLVGNRNVKGRLIVSVKDKLLPFLRKLAHSDSQEIRD